jgi:hypothetical protein
MTVYVDNVRHPYSNMVMCHLWADTLDELLAMVDRIGVQRKWIQGHPTLSEAGKARRASCLHFDIAITKRKLAIAAGAILTDKYGPVEHTARLDIASGESHRVKVGTTQLTLIEKIRARRTA